MFKSCLIGHTGFVGSNLAGQYRFDEHFRSTNIDEIRGKKYDLVMCAGVSAEKWRANRNPEQDWASIERLVRNLETIRASIFILISTVDVYPVTTEVDESFDCGKGSNHAYGRHRFALEQRMTELFGDCYVVRLPGLFGPGLKKNVIYDLLHDNCLSAINRESAYQYYDVTSLWTDVERLVSHDIRLANLVTEPLQTGRVLDACFPGKRVGTEAGPVARYDIHTRHAGVFGGTNGYRWEASEVLRRLTAFVESSRGSK